MNELTNSILAAISITLTTNTFFEYPKKWQSVPCPDKILGCSVAHVECFPVENPTTRQQIIEVREVVTLRLLSYDHKLELTNRVIWRTNSNQKLATTWIDIGQTNVVDESFNRRFVPTNKITKYIGSWNIATNGGALFDSFYMRKAN